MSPVILVKTPCGRTVSVDRDVATHSSANVPVAANVIGVALEAAAKRERRLRSEVSRKRFVEVEEWNPRKKIRSCRSAEPSGTCSHQFFSQLARDKHLQLWHEGRHVTSTELPPLLSSDNDASMMHFSIRVPICGGIDRQNRVGSKFGGGGVSSSQQSERERKERLKQLALESIDLAKDPYLMRNHLGTYECKLCLTLHTHEANYLAHTQGKKHQQGLAKRAHMEKLREQKEGTLSTEASASTPTVVAAPKVRIGRPAYQVFKSRDAETNQRCLSFELSFPEIDADLQPRHRFMSAFEQRVESPPDRRYQYLLFAADPYETVAFKIPNEPIDKEPGRFVTHWNADDKKFTLTLYFVEPKKD